MSDSNRGKPSQDLIAAGLGALALFATVILAFAIGTTLGINSGRDQVSAREHYENAKRDNLRACIGREGATAVECVAEAIEAAQEQSHSRQDLYAQRDMSRWAFWLLILTGITVAITAIGVWFVKRTLEATLDAVNGADRATEVMLAANSIALSALRKDRAWVKLTPHWENFTGEIQGVNCQNGMIIQSIMRNVGGTPALNIETQSKIQILDRDADVEPLEWDASKPVQAGGVLHIHMTQATPPHPLTNETIWNVARAGKKVALSCIIRYRDIYDRNQVRESQMTVAFHLNLRNDGGGIPIPTAIATSEPNGNNAT